MRSPTSSTVSSSPNRAKDVSEKELRRIDQFLMKGKSLAVFASAVNVKASDATMNASLSTHGLDKLLDGYGITLNKDVVLDRVRRVQVMVPTTGVSRRWSSTSS